MSIASRQNVNLPADAAGEESGELRAGVRPLFDLGAHDLTRKAASREDIERVIPHRGAMSLLDWIVYEAADYKQAIAVKQIRGDDFWVPGHFPDKPIFPGVLMVEAGAQLACYMYNRRRPDPKVVAFLRIENATFRHMVEPGNTLYLLAQEVKFGRRRFISDVQGMVGEHIAFEARISGMQL